MKTLQESEERIKSEFANLRERCLRGDGRAAKMIAYCGVKCADMLTELHQTECPGKVAVVEAAGQVLAWPIAYPALEEGWRYRIAAQIPSRLNSNLKLNRRELRAESKNENAMPDRPGEKTFIEEGMSHLMDACLNTYARIVRLGSIYTELIRLYNRCVKGNVEAVLIVAETGVMLADFLSSLQQMRASSTAVLAMEAAAKRSWSWPVSIRRETNLLALSNSVPSMLGADAGIRLKKKIAKKTGKTSTSGRDFYPNSRTGFALGYHERVERTRQQARKYADSGTAFLVELRKQGEVAASVLDEAGIERAIKSAASVDAATIEEIRESLWKVVDRLDDKSWRFMKSLPEFRIDNLGKWIEAAMLLVELDCQGDWTEGPWWTRLELNSTTRLKSSGTSIEKCRRHFVKRWISEGFEELLNTPGFASK